MIAEEMGFEEVVPVSGQTYSRKVDAQVVAALGGLAQSASKFSTDMRILQNFKEMEEPFEAASNRFFGNAVQTQSDAFGANHFFGKIRHY